MQLTHGAMPFNIWYVAAYGHDVTQQPLGRRICGKPVVFYRTASGQAVALEDRCSHRAMPLSHGECEGEIIRCIYHGLEFGPGGACMRIPNQERIPPIAAVRAYPLVEKDRLLWIWMGDPAKADRAKVPDNPLHNDPAWEVATYFHEVKADWQLIADNLLDLTHVGIVHRKTIGGEEDAHYAAKMRITSDENRVFMERHVPAADVPPSLKRYEALGIKFNGKIDRWFDVEMIPGMMRLWTGNMDAGAGAFDGRREGGFQLRHNHALTPSTPTSCYWHTVVMRNYMLGNVELNRRVLQMTADVQEEDKRVIEAQQRILLEEPERAVLDIASDGAQIQGRRLVQRWLAAETGDAR